MFDHLRSRLGDKIKQWQVTLRFNDKTIEDNLQDLRTTLLEADVALAVVTHFIDRVRQQARERIAETPANPSQAFIAVVHETLLDLLGAPAPLSLRTQAPATILVVGSPGAGKTTSTVKLGRWIKLEKKKLVAVASCDTSRPAAHEQLEILAGQAEIHCYPQAHQAKDLELAQSIYEQANRDLMDVLIVDTCACIAGEDKSIVHTLQAIQKALRPIETLLVLDSLTGQSALSAVQFFIKYLKLSGLVLTKTDADMRGGIALSARYTTQQAIKFIGSGEHLKDFSPFQPQELAQRILGLTLKADWGPSSGVSPTKQDQARAKAQLSGKKKYTLNDMRQELSKMKKMDGMKGLLSSLPGVPQNMLGEQPLQYAEKMFVKSLAIIDSMTPEERLHPDLIKAERKRRIAQGSGTDLPAVNQTLKQFNQTQKWLNKNKKRRKLLPFS